MSHASLADDGQGNGDPIRGFPAANLQTATTTAQTHTQTDCSQNHAYFVQRTAPADDFTEEVYAKVYTNTHDGTWWNNKLTYYGTPGTAGAFVEIWQDYNDNTALDVDAIYYFEQFNLRAGGSARWLAQVGLNPALKLHRWHEYRFSVSTVKYLPTTRSCHQEPAEPRYWRPNQHHNTQATELTTVQSFCGLVTTQPITQTPCTM